MVELGPADLGQIREIDRSERASGFYVVEGGTLRRVDRNLEIPGWTEEELGEAVDRIGKSLAAGGLLLGVRDARSLVGAAVLGGEWLQGAADRLELVFLHVSSTHRRRGLAGRLFSEVCRRARARGARQLYISSSDVEAAVCFYRGRGCRLAVQVDPAIHRRWPTDVQLTLEL